MFETDPKEQIKRLNQIGIALSSETNLRRLLSLIVKEARGFTRADAGSLYIREGDHLRFEVAQNDTIDRRPGREDDVFRPFPLPLTHESIAGHVALSGEILNIPDVYELDDSVQYSFNRDFDQRNNYRTQSMLVVPMRDHRSEIIGVLQLINPLDDQGRVVTFSLEVQDLVLSLASQAAVAIRNAQLIASIKKLFQSLVQYSASAIDARSPHTAGHSRRVAALVQLMAEAMNSKTEGPFAQTSFSEEELEELSYAAWLHDIGKIGVREWILDKANKLTDDRMEVIRARFNQITLGLCLESQRRLLALHQDGPPDPAQVAAVEAEREQRLAEVAADLELLERANKPGWLSDEDLARVQAIAAKEYTDLHGISQPYLTDLELHNLSVRKGTLNDEEYREIQSHVVLTGNIVNKIPFTQELARIPAFAAAHHEMLNGTGYPRKLKDGEIPLQARMLAVADVFDALVAKDRPYKPALPLAKSLSILQEEAQNGRLDPNVVELLIEEELWARMEEEKEHS